MKSFAVTSFGATTSLKPRSTPFAITSKAQSGLLPSTQ